MPQRYELVRASALILRIVGGHPPAEEQMAAITDVISEILATASNPTSEVAGHGWLVWTVEGLRWAFRQGCEIEQRLVASLPRLESILLHSAKIRWGLWVDQYLLPVDRLGSPVISNSLAQAIFNFEPDNRLSSSEAVYQANRRWEHFVCTPRRLCDARDDYGYLMIGHKRPSALDHAKVRPNSSFVGRNRDLVTIEDCWQRRADGFVKLAIIAEAGSGKTRLIKEWLRQRSLLRVLTATFSLFGGDLESFASQLTELPQDRLDCEAFVDAAVNRVLRDAIDVLVLDDIHWAGDDGIGFVRRLLAALSTTAVFVILAARPSGRSLLRTLHPTATIVLRPLTPTAVRGMAGQLDGSRAVSTAAAQRSKGNPLFVEQFAAWAAEMGFKGGESGPHSLHEIIAARIARLSKVRMADIRQQLRWGRSWECQAIDNELEKVEIEIGLWLDRLETGDYADGIEAARHLVQLEHLDYEIFIASTLAGRPRPRSGRLREAIERLLVGSADQILVDLKRRSARASEIEKENILGQAQRAGEVLFAHHNWPAARDFYELACSLAPLQRAKDMGLRLAQCRRRSQSAITDEGEVYADFTRMDLDKRPQIDALDLPYVWAELGRSYSCGEYFARAAEAAEAVNDSALAAWARRKAAEPRVAEESPFRA
jgi:CheY-like chemotaxis protein